jgi:hypothetical protein
MARLRFLAVALLALTLAGNSTQTARTQSERTTYTVPLTQKPAAEDRSCVIYSLTDRGFDADLGKWIAETIPQMIEPTSWQTKGGSGALSYYAPKNVLIVNQSAAIQSKVEGFLKDLKASMPKASATYVSGLKPARAKVVPADYRESEPLPPSSYPVPAAVKPPKHLFHFIIRYEGDGIIDDNVVKFMKAQTKGEKETSNKPAYAGPGCQPYMPAVTPAGSPPTTNDEALPAPPAGYTTPTSAGTPLPSTTPPQPSNAPAPKEKENKKDKPTESHPSTYVAPSPSNSKP